jgi:glyceraldehyde 3-phosphate dehydrogenase
MGSGRGFRDEGRLNPPRVGGAIVDARSTRVVGDRLVKVLAYYDNEFGYANRIVELAVLASRSGG